MAQGIDISEYGGVGYQPVVYSHDWMVAFLNYEGIMALEQALQLERHVNTDEVFILLEGKAAFYVVSEGLPLEVVELMPGLVYNILKGTWHNLLATSDVKLAIVENRDTDKFDTEMRPLTLEERQRIRGQLPGWAE